MNNSEGKQRKGFYYGWIVLSVCLLLITVSYGVRLSFGVFFKSLEEDFGWTRALTSSVFSVYMLTCALFAIVGGWVVDKYGGKVAFIVMGFATFLGLALTSRVSTLWQIYLSYGILVALGTGPAYTVAVSLATKWFEQRRGMALAIVTSGVGLGSILMAPIAAFFITSYGWRTSYVAVGLIALILTVPGVLVLRMPPRNKAVTLSKEEQKPEVINSRGGGSILGEEFSVIRAIKTRNFILLFLMAFFQSYCFFLVTTHIVPHAIDFNIPPMQAASIMSITGFANIPGRITMGFISDRYGRKMAVLICASVMAVSFVWLVQATNLWMLYVFAIVFSASCGGLGPPSAALAGDTFGVRHIGVIMGLLEIGWVSGAAVGPAVAGYIFDTTGSYSIAFWLCVVASLVIVALVLFIQVRKVGSKTAN